jgi:hypothetical protein
MIKGAPAKYEDLIRRLEVEMRNIDIEIQDDIYCNASSSFDRGCYAGLKKALMIVRLYSNPMRRRVSNKQKSASPS